MNRIYNIIQGSIYYKIFLSLLLLSMIPLTLFSFISYMSILNDRELVIEEIQALQITVNNTNRSAITNQRKYINKTNSDIKASISEVHEMIQQRKKTFREFSNKKRPVKELLEEYDKQQERMSGSLEEISYLVEQSISDLRENSELASFLVNSDLTAATQKHRNKSESITRQTTYMAILFFVLFASLFFVVTFILAKKIAGPVQELNRGVREVAGGNLDWTIDVKSRDEIGIFATEFNRMVAERKKAELALLESHNQLEKRVSERTAELIIAKEQAESADRLKSVFLSTMSHELRTPLNAIIGFTSLILEGASGPINSEQEEQLSMVQGSSRHLLNLINDVLDISKIEAGQLEIYPAPFNINELVTRVSQTVGPLAENKKLRLISSLSPNAGEMISDERRLEQVLINLLNNAIKFTEEGEVHIKCEVRENSLLIQVKDTGIGIKTKDVNKLFKPFQQIDSKITRQYEGTGLGLSICAKLLNLLDGDIEVQSIYGKGSTFTVILPLDVHVAT